MFMMPHRYAAPMETSKTSTAITMTSTAVTIPPMRAPLDAAAPALSSLSVDLGTEVDDTDGSMTSEVVRLEVDGLGVGDPDEGAGVTGCGAGF